MKANNTAEQTTTRIGEDEVTVEDCNEQRDHAIEIRVSSGSAQCVVDPEMSRTNKSPRRFPVDRWTVRYGHKADRAWTREHVRLLNESAFETLLADIAADRLEERGALAQAMKVRNPHEPLFPTRPRAKWRC